MSKIVLLVFLLFGGWSATRPPQQIPIEVVSYDDFMHMERRERLRVFNEISPGNRAAIVRTHVQRWLAKNREQLSDEQVALVEETFRVLTPEVYTPEGREKRADEIAELQERMRESLDDTQWLQFFHRG